MEELTTEIFEKLSIEKFDSYYTSEVKEGYYIETTVVKTVDVVIEIEAPEEETIVVTHIGPNGRIKFMFQGENFTCHNPISNYFGKTEDTRDSQQVIAICKDLNYRIRRVIDIKNLIFDRGDMDTIFNEYFIKNGSSNSGWVELPKP